MHRPLQLALTLLSILVSTLLYHRFGSPLWRWIIWIATGVLFVMALLSGFSIGLFFLPSVLLALLASVSVQDQGTANTRVRNNI